MAAPAALPAETHTIVVGAGTGGATCAGLLAEHADDPILLLEAGPDYGSLAAGHWPRDMLDARTIPVSHDWEFQDLPRARVVGGCSSHNGCTAAVGAPLDYDEWAGAGAQGWSAEEVVPLLDLVRDRFRVRTYGMEELAPAHATFIAAAQRWGLPFATDLDRLEAGVGVGPVAANVVDGVRWNAAFAFLDPVRDRPNLQIQGGVLVDRVIIEGGEVRGVEAIVDGRRHTIRAERIVLSGGAYATPAVLLRSGIGPAADARRLGIEPISDLPGVGQNLRDHALVQLAFAGSEAFTASMRERSFDEQSLGRARSSLCDDGPYDIHLLMVTAGDGGEAGAPPIALYGGAMRPRSRGEVRLQDAQATSLPVVDHRFGSDPEGHDVTVLAEAAAMLRELAGDGELATVLGRELPAAEGILPYCHPAGTCRIGAADDPLAVAGTDGEVHGVSGLYVADASLMPTLPRGNINLPTAMVAARVAAALLGGRLPTAA